MRDILLGHSVSQSFSQSIKLGRQLKFHCPLSEARGNKDYQDDRDDQDNNQLRSSAQQKQQN